MTFPCIFRLLRPRGTIPRSRTRPAAPIRPRPWTSAFTTSASLPQKPNPPRPKPPPEEEIEEFFLKGSGPGGQKIVRLRALPPL